MSSGIGVLFPDRAVTDEWLWANSSKSDCRPRPKKDRDPQTIELCVYTAWPTHSRANVSMATLYGATAFVYGDSKGDLTIDNSMIESYTKKARAADYLQPRGDIQGFRNLAMDPEKLLRIRCLQPAPQTIVSIRRAIIDRVLSSPTVSFGVAIGAAVASGVMFAADQYLPMIAFGIGAISFALLGWAEFKTDQAIASAKLSRRA